MEILESMQPRKTPHFQLYIIAMKPDWYASQAFNLYQKEGEHAIMGFFLGKSFWSVVITAAATILYAVVDAVMDDK